MATVRRGSIPIMADTGRNILPRALLILRRADSSIRNQSRRVRRVNTLRRGSILRPLSLTSPNIRPRASRIRATVFTAAKA